MQQRRQAVADQLPERAARAGRRPSVDLLTLKQTHFVVWRPRGAEVPPRLVIGGVLAGPPVRFREEAEVPLLQSAAADELWELPAAALGLPDGVYHYWFLVKNEDVYDRRDVLLHRTD